MVTRLFRAAFLISLLCLSLTYAEAIEGRQRPLSQRERVLSKQAKLTFEDAKKIVMSKVPGRIFNWELEKENGKLIYSVQIELPKDKIHSREVNVDAMTGKIVSIEKENLKLQLAKAKAEGEASKER